MPVEDKKKPAPAEDLRDEANWEQDIEKRGYYYDDATGYEVYEPEDEDESGEDEEDLSSKADKS
jgi:hypothetical protein